MLPLINNISSLCVLVSQEVNVVIGIQFIITNIILFLILTGIFQRTGGIVGTSQIFHEGSFSTAGRSDNQDFSCKMATERLSDKSPILHGVITNFGSRDVYNRTFNELYLRLGIVFIEFSHILGLTNIKGDFFRGVGIFRDKLLNMLNPWNPALRVGRHPFFI